MMGEGVGGGEARAPSLIRPSCGAWVAVGITRCLGKRPLVSEMVGASYQPLIDKAITR
jgi:hypothetical protein